MDPSLSPDQRADLLLEQMTLEEKLTLVHGGAAYSGPRRLLLPRSRWAEPGLCREFRGWGFPTSR